MLPELTQLTSLRTFMTTDVTRDLWHYALDLAQGLRAYDTDTTLCVIGPRPDPEQERSARRIRGLKLIFLDLPASYASSPYGLQAASNAVAAIARQEGARVIHLNNPELAANADYPAPVVSACHSCVATRWHAVRTEPLERELRWHKEFMALGLMRSDAVIAPTASFARCMSETYHLPALPSVVHKGRRPSMRESLTEGTTAPTAIFAITACQLWDDGYNLKTLDAAAGKLDLSLFAVGPCESPDTGQVSFSHIRWLGHLREGQLAEWLAAKPIFVSTAIYEPFGLQVLEAAEMGCTLVLSDIPTHRELWEGAALFAPPHDADAFATAIRQIAEDSRLRTLLASAARRRARRYTAEVMAAKVRAIYGGLLRTKVRHGIRTEATA